MKFFLNPGHCKDIINYRMEDPGACNVTYDLREAVIVDKIGKELKFYLEASGHDVYYLQSNNLRNNPSDDNLNYPCIVTEENNWGADYAISIHLNAFNCWAQGTETIVFCRGSEAEKMAKYIQSSIVQLMKTFDRGIKYEEDKLPHQRLSFITRTAAPAILIECCFIDNDEDAQLLLNDESILRFAKAIYVGIQKFLENEG